MKRKMSKNDPKIAINQIDRGFKIIFCVCPLKKSQKNRIHSNIHTHVIWRNDKNMICNFFYYYFLNGLFLCIQQCRVLMNNWMKQHKNFHAAAIFPPIRTFHKQNWITENVPYTFSKQQKLWMKIIFLFERENRNRD